MPYDPPSAAAWSHDGITRLRRVQGRRHGHHATRRGAWAATASSPSDPTIAAYHAFEVPNNADVKFHDLLTVSLGGKGSITHVINDTGATAQGTATRCR